MDVSEEARRAQDAMILADTAITSTITGPDYIPVGKGGKPLKPKSPRYNLPAYAISNHRADLDSRTGSILKKNVGFSGTERD